MLLSHVMRLGARSQFCFSEMSVNLLCVLGAHGWARCFVILKMETLLSRSKFIGISHLSSGWRSDTSSMFSGSSGLKRSQRGPWATHEPKTLDKEVSRKVAYSFFGSRNRRSGLFWANSWLWIDILKNISTTVLLTGGLTLYTCTLFVGWTAFRGFRASLVVVFTLLVILPSAALGALVDVWPNTLAWRGAECEPSECLFILTWLEWECVESVKDILLSKSLCNAWWKMSKNEFKTFK